MVLICSTTCVSGLAGTSVLPDLQRSGLTNELMAGLSSFLVEEGIDVNDLATLDLETFQAAMDRAIERRNIQLFTPVGSAREIAIVTLRLVVEAILDSNTELAGAILDQVQPESEGNSVATIANCIGILLGLLDDWMSGRTLQAPETIAVRVRLPKGHWVGERSDRRTRARRQR